MEELCTRTLLTEKIKLEPVYLNQNFKSILLQRLKQKIEGVCSKHGYIRKDSVELYKIAPGCIEILSLNGNINYDIQFYADVCNPLIGTVIKGAKVVNMNRFGILVEAKVFATSVLEIIVAKNSVNIVSEIDLDTISIGDDVNVEVIGKKFNIGDKKISVIGKIVKNVNKEPRYITKARSLEEEDEDFNEAIEVEEEVEADEEVEEEEDEEEEEKIGGSELFSSDEEDFEEILLSDAEENSASEADDEI